jgi:hypothetical protein
MYGYPNTKSDNHKRRYINMKTVQQKAKKMHVDSVSLFLLLLLLSRVAIFGRRLFFRTHQQGHTYITYYCTLLLRGSPPLAAVTTAHDAVSCRCRPALYDGPQRRLRRLVVRDI